MRKLRISNTDQAPFSALTVLLIHGVFVWLTSGEQCRQRLKNYESLILKPLCFLLTSTPTVPPTDTSTSDTPLASRDSWASLPGTSIRFPSWDESSRPSRSPLPSPVWGRGIKRQVSQSQSRRIQGRPGIGGRGLQEREEWNGLNILSDALSLIR